MQHKSAESWWLPDGCRPDGGHRDWQLSVEHALKYLRCVRKTFSPEVMHYPVIHNTHADCLYMCSSIRTILHMPAHIQFLQSTFLISYLPSSSSVAPGLATNTGSEGEQPSSCHSVVCFVLVSSFISYKSGRLK